jgi:NUMOD3 motif
MNNYYVYQYVRDDNTPYYIGKGKLDRAWKSHKRSNGSDPLPADKTKIQIIKENLTEEDAYDLEKQLISEFGLKADGGILVNLTYGGEGGTQSLEVREQISKKLTGIKRGPRTDEHKRKLSEAAKGIPKPRSEEHQAAWNQSSKNNWANNPARKESVSKLGKSNKGRKHTPESLEKKRQAMLRYWSSKKSQSL